MILLGLMIGCVVGAWLTMTRDPAPDPRATTTPWAQ